MDKVNTKVDFMTNSRDDTCIQIVEVNKIISEMSKTIENMRTQNKQTKEEIVFVRFDQQRALTY